MGNSESPERRALLESINQTLRERGLKAIHRLGDRTKSEIEIVGLREIYDHSQRFFTDVKFNVIFPDGSAGEYTFRFNANSHVSDGVIMVVIVNGKFAIMKQWRLPLGQWMYEVPRGFGEGIDQAQIGGQLGTLKIGDLPLGTFLRELREEVMAEAAVSSVTHLGNVAQNSSTDATVPSYFLVQIQVPEARLRKRLRGSDDEVLTIELWDMSTIRSELGRKINDNHSIVALTLALNFIDSLPRF